MTYERNPDRYKYKCIIVILIYTMMKSVTKLKTKMVITGKDSNLKTQSKDLPPVGKNPWLKQKSSSMEYKTEIG